jgi:hypothetical protein
MPRRIYTYQSIPSWNMLNMISTIGAFVFALAQVLLVLNLVYTVRSGAVAPVNPWGATGLEWTPTIMGASGAHDAPGSAEEHVEGYHGGGHEEHYSPRPIQLAAGMAVTFFGLCLFTYYQTSSVLMMLAGFVVLGYTLIGWAGDDTKNKFKFPDTPSERWPFTNIPKLRLAMWIFLSSDIIVFGAIIASDLYLRINDPAAWPLPGAIHDINLGLILTIILLTSGLTAVLALEAAKAGKNPRPRVDLHGDQGLRVVWVHRDPEPVLHSLGRHSAREHLLLHGGPPRRPRHRRDCGDGLPHQQGEEERVQYHQLHRRRELRALLGLRRPDLGLRLPDVLPIVGDMMKTSLSVGIWLYLVVASVVEVVAYRVNPGGLNIDIVIGVIASVSAVVTALFSMNIREESTAVKYLFLVPVLLVGVLIITLLLAFPIIQ